MMSKVFYWSVLQVLLFVWFATALPAAEEEGETRADALQEAYEKFTLQALASEPTSSFFGSCLATARTIDAKLASITVAGSEYVRYVPTAAIVAATPITYTAATATPAIASITDCATAAKTAGSKMFKYGGGSDCKLSTIRYDLNTAVACEDALQSAVFILNT